MEIGSKQIFTIKTLVIHRFPFIRALAKSLAIAVPCGKKQTFTKDFAKEWVGYVNSLANISITKESLFGIAKGNVNRTLRPIHTEFSDSDTDSLEHTLPIS